MSNLIVVDTTKTNAVVVAGSGNTVSQVTARATDPKASHVEGYQNEAQGWYGHAEGTGTIAEGKISHAEGNNTVCGANDSSSEGNMTVTGRRMYAVAASGSEDAGDGLGVLQYVTLATAEGDATSHFPNPLTDNVTTRYGAGAQKDVKGNIYASGFVPAVWTGDTPTTPNDLQWAAHPYCVLKGSGEAEKAFVQIAKATYVGGATKVYYVGAKPFSSLSYVYSSYSPVVLNGGNGQHAEGIRTSTHGYGSHAEGQLTRAWGNYGSHAEGYQARATGGAAHAENWNTVASGDYAHAEGNGSVASAPAAHAEGSGTQATGNYSHAEGNLSQATGAYGPHSEGYDTRAGGAAAHAEGWQSNASGDYSHAEGRGGTASGPSSHTEGYGCQATGSRAHAEGHQTTASGDYSHAQGSGTVASGHRSHAEGLSSTASGDTSRAQGYQAIASRPYQDAYSVGGRAVAGDCQISRITYQKSCANAGWHDIRIFESLVDGRVYHFSTMVIGRQTAGTAGTVGDSFAYRAEGAFTVEGGVLTMLGAATITLIGRSAGMTGDGLTTGPRITMYTSIYQGHAVLRFDGLADTTFYVSAHSTVQELG